MDLNGDGYKDILSGSYSRNEQPMAGLFQVLWGKADRTFQQAEVLQGTDGEPLLIPLGSGENGWIDGICTRPTAVDWDGDGKLDLVVGNFTGTFCLFMGEGKGRFQPQGQWISTDNGPLKISGHHSDPFLVDWDQDGDLDLLSGSTNGDVQWAENDAGAGKPPKLKPFQPLIARTAPLATGQLLAEADLKGPSASTRIWVDDVNSDGKLDILAGDMVNLVSVVEGLSDQQRAKYAEWQKEWEAALAGLDSAAADEAKQAEARQAVQNLYARRASFVRDEMTGFVWLYLQK